MFGGLHPSEVSQAHHGVTPLTFGAPFVTEMKSGHMYSYVINSNFCTNFQTTQSGDMLFRYSITSHEGNWIGGQPRDFGWAAGNPLIPVTVDGKSDGDLPETLSFCQVDQPNVMLLALKRAEDDEGIIIRLNETEGSDTEVNLTLPMMSIEKVFETNLVEENKRPMDFQGQTINIPIKGFGLKTVRIVHAKSTEP
jgi:alpha-mannosidase